MKRLLLTAVLVGVLCPFAFAPPFTIGQPSWRGQSETTVERWEFNTSNTTPLPDEVYNPFGNPSIFVYPTHPWFAQWGGMEGVWHLSGAIKIDIPNNPVDRETKLLQIQLTWASQYPDAALIPPRIGIEAKRVNGQIVPQGDIALLSQTSLTLGLTNEPGAGTYWHHTTYLYEITPNPMFETIWITGSVAVDNVVIDTICIPEPATIAISAIGAIFLRKNRQICSSKRNSFYEERRRRMRMKK